MSLLTLPIHKGLSARQLDRWFARREVTLRLAVAADEESGNGRRDWNHAYGILDETLSDSILMALLDRVL